jgi:Undecaprenyl-phosphate glucose phosphotransferase
VLRKYSEVFRSLAMLADLTVVAAAWLLAVWLRFGTNLFPPPPEGYIPERETTVLLLGILPVWHVLLRGRHLYDARRMRSVSREVRRLLEVTAMGIALLGTASFLLKLSWLSRLVVALFAVLSVLGMVAFRTSLRLALRAVRRRGYNQRRVLIVGTGALAREVYTRIQRHPEMGLIVDGFLGPSRASGERTGALPPHRGGYEALGALVHSEAIDHVIFALDRGDSMDPIKMLEELRDTTAAVRIVPDLMGLTTLQSGVEDIDGLPMIRVIESPLVGWSRVATRALDASVAGAALLVTAPLFALIALAIRASSPGPVFYRQQRMGLDGELFEMIKFRSMRVDAEKDTGAVWAIPDDARRTRLGAWLRRTNLDELPQLWNVLRGEMSLVGPRPERPEFIQQFRTQMPGYMLRHKVRGGLTGWAQVNGCRGNTSIERRLAYDMEYLRSWSLTFDLKILALTVVRAFNDPNAY